MGRIFSKDGKIVETTIDVFDGGIKNDPRDPRENTCRMVSNFDIVTNPNKMTPYTSSESGDDDAAASQKRNFCLGYTGSAWRLYSAGFVAADDDDAEFLNKALTTGATNDLGDDGWANQTNYQAASGQLNPTCFVYYDNATAGVSGGRIYFGNAGRYIGVFDPTDANAVAPTATDLTTYSNIAQGLVHSKDDILYIPYDNKIASKNGSAVFTVPALTLPTGLVITSICEYGNYLAIAAADKAGIGNSRVYLWDRDSTLTTLDESIDWGVGSLMILEEIDGELVGISQVGGKTSSMSGLPNQTVSKGDRVIFRRLVGGKAKKFLQLKGSSNETKLPISKQKVDDRLYFMMLINYGGSARGGVWSIGRSELEKPLALVHERTVSNNTASAMADNLYGFIVVGDYLLQAYDDGGVYAVSKTVVASTYSHNSIYESKKFDAGNPGLKKKLVGVTLSYEYLPTAGDVILKYRVDENTAWTQIMQDTTNSSISHSAINIESSGANLPTDYKEIEFQILSQGGAEITSLSFKEEVTGKRTYD